jgi:hypothetical protein
MPEMNIMDQTGHTRTIWDASNAIEVEAARATYDRLTREGYRAFHVKKDGDQGVRMDNFDPSAEKMIMVPQLKGG